MKFNDPKFKYEIFVRIDMMKHSYFSNYLFATNFSVVETVVVCQKINSCLCIILVLVVAIKKFKVTNLTLYMYLFIKIS